MSHHPLLEGCPVIYTQKVTWGEMDAYEHVNNTVYFRYFENVRLAHFEMLGCDALYEAEQLGFILGEIRCRFRFPLSYPDTVHIGAKVTQLQSDRFVHVYTVVSEKHNAIAAEGDGRVVFYDYKVNSRAPLPAAVMSLLEQQCGD